MDTLHTTLTIRLPPAQSRAWEDGDDWHMWLDLLDDLTWAGIPCLVRVVLDDGTVVGELDPTAIEGRDNGNIPSRNTG